MRPEVRKEKINEIIGKLMDRVDNVQQVDIKGIEEELGIRIEVEGFTNNEEMEVYLKGRLGEEPIDIEREMQEEMRDF